MSRAADVHLDNLISTRGYRGGLVATLRAIARFTPDDRAGCCYAGESTLAESAGIDARSVRRHVATLWRDGIIVRRRHAGGQGRGRNTDEIRICGFNDQPDRLSGFTCGLTGQPGPTNRTSCADQPDNRCSTRERERSLLSLTLPLPPHGPEVNPGERNDLDGIEGQGQANPTPPDPIDSSIPASRRPLLALLRADGQHPAIVEQFVRPMLVMLGVPPGKDGPAYVRAIRDKAAEAGEIPEAALRRAAKRFVDERTRDLPWFKDILPALAEARAALMVKLPAGDPRWAAWLAYDRRDPAKSAYAAHVERSRSDYAATALWPPASPDAEEVAGKVYIPHGTPEHAAWLAHWRRQGRDGAVKAQTVDVARTQIVEATRWPPLAADRAVQARPIEPPAFEFGAR